jgi:hypothetical protein
VFHIKRARVDAEGGQLHVEGVPGPGTVVTLTLPAVPESGRPGPTGGVPRSIPVDLACLRTIVVCTTILTASAYLRDAVKLCSPRPRFHVIGKGIRW